MTHPGGISHSTGTGPLTGATPDNPITTSVDDPTRRDVDNASNKDTYARAFWESGGVVHMRAVLVYTKDYTIQAWRWHYGYYLTPRRTNRPAGNGAEKRKNPWEWGYVTAEKSHRGMDGQVARHARRTGAVVGAVGPRLRGSQRAGLRSRRGSGRARRSVS